MTSSSLAKGKRFYEYLLELTKLTGNVVRDYKRFEKNWDPEELKKIEGCIVDDEINDEDTFLEINKPLITKEEVIPPTPDEEIRDWLNFNYNSEIAVPDHKKQLNGNHEENFEDDESRVKIYQSFISEWREWSKNLKEKRKLEALYDEFFDLISRFEREGESLELLFGKGMLTWNHPDNKVGLIRSPILTQKLELKLDADIGKITATRIDQLSGIEREMLSGVRLPNKKQVDEIFNSLSSVDIRDDVSDLLTQLVHMINAKGEYSALTEGMGLPDNPVIYDKSVFIFRVKKTRVLRDDLESIVEQIDSGKLEMNKAVSSLLGDKVEPNSNNNTNTSYKSEEKLPNNELFFPLAHNEQQKEIVKRVERNYGVTVQGPPGTGKTHTIANLVSHFLAEGKSVLVTSQKESPLRVLKNKIPEDIQDLCVPVLGGGRDSFKEIQQSVDTISEKLGELDTDKLSRDVELNLNKLDKSKRNESKLMNQLKDYTEKEGTVLEYQGEELYKYDVAKKLSESVTDYKWILDDIDMASEIPITEFEFKELWGLRDRLTIVDLKLYNTSLPKIDEDLRNNKGFNDFVNEGKQLEKGKDEGSQHLETYQLPMDITEINESIESLENILKYEHIIENDSCKLILNDLRAGGARKDRWTKLISDMESNRDQLFKHYNELVTHHLDLPEKPLNELKEDVSIAKERIESGKKPNFAFFLFKGKQTKYLFDTPVLNNKSISTIEDFKPIEEHIKYQELKEETARILNGNMTEVNQPTIDQKEGRFPHILEDRLNELKAVIKVFEIITELEDDLTINHNDLYSVNEVNILLDNFKKALKYLEYKEWHEQYQIELNELKSVGSYESMHSIVNDFIEAFESQDTDNWNTLVNQLIELNDKKKNVINFYELLSKMDEIIPLTKKSIEMSVGKEFQYPEKYLEAFELRKLQTWLDQTKDINSTQLRKSIEKEKNTQKELIRDIVRDSTWNNQIERISEKEKRALSSWKSYIKRFGKGTGQYASQNLKGARKAMKNAQSAIPVWIMPTMQVLENFSITNDKFDVVIFDESSQCDIFSANVLLRGKKMIVVGDDEQISPQAIGVNQGNVNELVNRYLPDIPNSDLFDGNISLYEIAEQTFPKEGKLMLREHFRCVPEIIQFSNDLSYGGEMIPLRLPLDEEKIDPPVTAIKVEEGYNDEKEKDINRPEAEAIANDVYEIVHNSKYDNQTIGVITLQGDKQHKLLETLIREKIGDAEYVNRKIICGNPYELQGDERDIIFLSMVVASNRNFRQLTKSSEKQRYNVAASRAKNQMRLYHSVDTNELNNTDYRYSLLSYCKYPSRVNEEVENLEHLCESPFELDVLRMILAKGYKVTPQVKVGGYRIDFVIEGIRDRLAVECDGERWHGPEKFEEDMQRQESLERAGWKFWRVRGREFYFNRKKAMESLWSTLDALGIEPDMSRFGDEENVESESMNFRQQNKFEDCKDSIPLKNEDKEL